MMRARSDRTSLPGVVVFHVRPDARSRYAMRIEIHPTLKAMRAVLTARDRRAGRMRYSNRKVLASCFCEEWRAARSRRLLPIVGTIVFARTRLGVGVVAHEAFHATLRILERAGHPLIETSSFADHSVEEVAATIHENLCRKIYRQLYRRNIIQ